jgi:integrase
MSLPAVRNKGALLARKRKRYPNRALAEAQIRLLFSSVDNIRDDALIRLGLSVGLRVSEVVTIRTGEIDFDRGLIKIWDKKKDKWRQVCAPRNRCNARQVRWTPHAINSTWPVRMSRPSVIRGRRTHPATLRQVRR